MRYYSEYITLTYDCVPGVQAQEPFTDSPHCYYDLTDEELDTVLRRHPEFTVVQGNDGLFWIILGGDNE